MQRRTFIAGSVAVLAAGCQSVPAIAGDRRLLYVGEPGIRNDTSYGGVGVLVFDRDNGYEFVKRIPTWKTPFLQEPENVKGIAASAATGRLYLSTIKRMGCVDLLTEEMIWSREYDGGCDRMAISPDGKTLYVPSFEGPHWNVVDAATGDVLAKITQNSRSHNTVYSLDGAQVYLEGLSSPMLVVVAAQTRTVAKSIGPFSNFVRPFTVNGRQTICFVNVDDLLGFEVGDLETGKVLHRVEVAGFQKGEVKRHGCPSHGIGLTPDETQLWVSDGHNSRMHIFDATVMPPKQMASVVVRDQPGWVSFSFDGRFAYASTGEVFDTRTKQRVAALRDEQGRNVGSEKLLEVDCLGGRVVRTGNQFGLGMKQG